MTNNDHGTTQQEYSLVSQAEKMKLWPEHMKVFRVNSDNMYPTLNQDDYAVVDTTRKSLFEGIFAVQFPGGGVAIKRLQPLVGGKLLVKNDNDRYESHEIDASSLDEDTIIGRIVFLEKRVY